MSTLQLKGFKNKTTLPHFKSTNSIHPRTRHARTPSKHHHNSYLPTHSPSIDHDSTMTSKALLQTNLPDIHSKKSSQKRSTFLQMWLDEALDPQDKQGSEESPQLRVEVDKTGPLRTVQKFQIDKKYLKSQNISVELIDKMYHSLYVYTHGINHTFQQLLSLTKASQHSEKKIIDSFWKAFIRLLEGCTSFQTTFQIIEQSHIKAKQELKDTYRLCEEEWMRDKSALEAENIKLMKKINQQSLTISKITTDFNISEATLQLTDQAFNDEVNVRLMFEEKVNAVFSSYDQLRNKYTQLLSDLRARESEEQAANKRESKLKKQLQLSQIRLSEATKQLQRARKDIEIREGELTLKRQEIFQLQGINQQLVDEKGQNDESVRRIVNKVTQYKHLYEEHKAQSNTKTLLLNQIEKRLEEQNKELQIARSLEEKLYSQLQENSGEISSLKQRQIQLSLQLDQAQAERDKKIQKALQLQQVNLELASALANVEKDLTQAQGELSIKDSLIEKNSASIAALQAVNAKLESLLSATTTEKAYVETELHKAVEISERFKEEMIGMKMLLESKATELQQIQTKLENERQVFRSKIGGLKDEIEFKEHKVMEMHNQHAQGQQIVKRAEEQLQQLRSENEQLRSHKLNLESQLAQLKIRVEALQNEIQKKGVAFRNLEQTLTAKEQQLKKYQQEINQKQSLLDSGGQHYEVESKQLRGLLEGYRADRERKTSYIHPMIYEDFLEQINRLTQTKQHLIKLCQQKDSELARYCIELEASKKEADSRIEEIRRSALLSEEKMSVLKEKQRVLQKKLQDSQSLEKVENKKSQQHIKSLQQEQTSLNSKIKQLLAEMLTKDTVIIDLENSLSSSQSEKKQLQHKLYVLNQQLLSSQLQGAKLRERNLVLENQKIQQSHQQVRPIEKTKDRPQLQQKETQTDKKFNHSFKFEIAQHTTSSAVQANQQEITLETKDGRQSPVRDRETKKVQANEFKRALKITYMRR